MIIKELFDELLAYIRDKAGVGTAMPLTTELLIEDDLGVTGNEAIELVDGYAERFNVDTTGLTYARYFYPEPSAFVTYQKVLPFTIGHLVDGIDLGKLNDEIIGTG